MFGETKIVTPYFQQMTLRSKILKIIHTLLQKLVYFVIKIPVIYLLALQLFIHFFSLISFLNSLLFIYC